MTKQTAKLMVENEALRLTLSFYANPLNWRNGKHYTPVLADNGERARAVLTERDEDIGESQRRGLAFLNALVESDRATRIRFLKYIGALAAELRKIQGLDEVVAIEHAAEFFAALVWNKVQVPQKRSV